MDKVFWNTGKQFKLETLQHFHVASSSSSAGACFCGGGGGFFVGGGAFLVGGGIVFDDMSGVSTGDARCL